MADRLAGKTALVTGGSRGIGAAIARRLAADGADVTITYAGNATAAAEVVAAITAAGRRGRAIQADAADGGAVRAAVVEAAEALGGLDILIHNAGVADMQPIDQVTDDASFTRQFGVNVAGVFNGTAAAVPHLRDGGRIVIIGSVSSHTAFGGDAIYGATKAAVAGLARGWARDLAARNILVNVIQPGPVDTDMNPADGAFSDLVLPRVALARYGRVDEIAGVAAFLASDDASYITGATLDVDGGYSI